MLQRFLVGGISLFFLLGGIALANNTHTVEEWYHGLGDGKDSDFYVHPFNHSNSGHYHSSDVVVFRRQGSQTILVDAKSCGQKRHCHVKGLDTSPISECRFYSSHQSNSNHPLTNNRHYHHNWCG